MNEEKLCITRKPRKRFYIPREDLERARQTMSVNYMARHFGVSRSTMYRLLREAGLTNGNEKPA